MSNTIDALIALIHKEFEIDPATMAADKPLAEYGLDSLSLAELIFAVEDHFHIDYPEDRVNVQSLSELASVVDAAVAARPQGDAAAKG